MGVTREEDIENPQKKNGREEVKMLWGREGKKPTRGLTESVGSF